MKQIKLISALMIGVFALSLFAPTVSAVTTGSGSADSTSTATIGASNSVDSLLTQLRKDKADFEVNKLAEETAQAASTSEKTVAKRKAALAKAAAAKTTKDEKRKVVLTRLLDIQIKQLGNTKDRVAKMTNIKADLKTQLNTNIDAAVAALTAKKAEVTAATTPEALKQLAKDIKDLFKTKRDIVKQIVDAILASRTEGAITAAQGRLADLTAKIAALKANGQDTTVLDALLATAQLKLSTAATKAGKEDLKGAISDLREAYNNMKKALAKAEGQPAVSPTPTPTPTPTPSV